MDIYQRKSRWKIYLAVVGAIIVIISLIYTNFLTSKLAAEEQNKAEVIAIVLEELNKEVKEENNQDVTPFLEILGRNATIPVMVVVDGKIYPDLTVNFPNTEQQYLENRLKKMQAKNTEPLTNNQTGNEIYFEESTILTQLRFFPAIQLALIAAFVFFGYLNFSAARRAEQNRVWVGMAKETAHQLGTPISGIVAWIEHLRLLKEDDTEVHEILDELGKDVNRLDLIADRFSKIGSAPSLEAVNIYDELDSCRAYMQRRASRHVHFDFPPADQQPPLQVQINQHLFDWVIENLLRNALDAMGSKGEIRAIVYEEPQHVCIDLSDTGKGIPASKFKTIFRPGYTTKKRGWGLGLSLAKRIIEEYHSGKIFVKKSEEEKGTTFTIKLPKK